MVLLNYSYQLECLRNDSGQNLKKVIWEKIWEKKYQERRLFRQKIFWNYLYFIGIVPNPREEKFDDITSCKLIYEVLVKLSNDQWILFNE